MAVPRMAAPCVHVDGKFFRLGGKKFYPRGLTYGPFAPNEQKEMFPSREQTVRDFLQLRELGANLLRIYYVPPRWFLDLAAEHELKLLVDVPWQKHLCFLESEKSKAEARDLVRAAVQACQGHPAVFAFSVVNEIPAEIVRWSGVRRVTDFIEELVDVAKSADPDCLSTFTSYPPSEVLTWQIESAFRFGLAGTIIFSYTDDWFRGEQQIEDWGFGLTGRDRKPKESFWAVQKMFRNAPYFALPRYPKVSVVVASYNGARTLKPCLESLTRLAYPDYEVIFVDDGSTDSTPEIAREFPGVRCIRQDNHGLSVARNTGIASATGEIVAFTDSDCRADEDWLYYLVGDLLSGEWAGIGGHNFLPPDDSSVAAAVMASPGGPAHVMFTDREAEHLPGCNMAFYKWALEEIGGFDPVFRKAGDDVDLCWRLQERGFKLGFSPAGFVWHYRRSTIGTYLKQQAGYGEAE